MLGASELVTGNGLRNERARSARTKKKAKATRYILARVGLSLGAREEILRGTVYESSS